jgi:serine/threonine-protein kinase
MAAIVRDEPAPLDAPANICAIVTRCLRKSPDGRFQTMSEIRAALEQAKGAPGEDVHSIAVLPFTNIGEDKEDLYFSDGLTEEILNALSQVEALQVAARTSSFYFRGKDVELCEIAAKLNVANLLQGSVRRAGKRIRVAVQLVDARNGFQLWSERYDRQMQDIFEVQDEIARQIAERFKVTPANAITRSTHNLEAYELYLKGRYHWHQRSPATLHLASQFFEQAIQVDPQYALAWAGLADCYSILRIYCLARPEDIRQQAHFAMSQAVALAPALWEVNYSRGLYIFSFERHWREAGTYFQKALDTNPKSPLARIYHAVFLSLDGREEEAEKQVTLARQSDPLSPYIHGIASVALISMRRFEASLEAARQALDLQPEYLLGLWALGSALCGLGRCQEAIEPLERIVNLFRAPVFLGSLGLVYGLAGRLDDAHRLLRELEERGRSGEYVPSLAVLCIYTGIGHLPDIRRALADLLAEGSPLLNLAAIDAPLLKDFHDPEIRRLLAEFYRG